VVVGVGSGVGHWEWGHLDLVLGFLVFKVFFDKSKYYIKKRRGAQKKKKKTSGRPARHENFRVLNG
jgi:hypothetical protein